MRSRSEKQPKRAGNSAEEGSFFSRFRDVTPVRWLIRLTGVVLVFLSILISNLSGQIADPVVSTNERRGLVIVIPVEGTINSGTSFFIQRMIRKAEAEEAAALVLQINSPGGLLTASQEIKDALLRTDVLTVAYIRGRALSAAALIAISCHKIIMEPGSEMGAASPMLLLGSAVQAAPEKMVSALEAEFKSTAEARKRPQALAGAMVNKDRESIPGLSKRGEVLTLTTETAFSHGYCDHIVTSIESGMRRLNIVPDPLVSIHPTSGEVVARWLTDPNIAVLLFTIGFWGIIIEFLTPGIGVAGITGVICLSLFFGGHLFAYLAGLEVLLLFVLGVFLLLLEFLVIPGFGIPGVGGILAVSVSVILVFGGIYSAVYAVSKIVVLSIGVMIGLFYFGPKVGLFDRFVLKASMNTKDGYVAVNTTGFDKYLNLEGVTLSACRPAGIVRVGGDRLEVVSDGEFIERNQRIVVTKIEGTKIVVRALTT